MKSRCLLKSIHDSYTSLVFGSLSSKHKAARNSRGRLEFKRWLTKLNQSGERFCPVLKYASFHQDSVHFRTSDLFEGGRQLLLSLASWLLRWLEVGLVGESLHKNSMRTHHNFYVSRHFAISDAKSSRRSEAGTRSCIPGGSL